MILVTGATGTVGRELVPQLLARGQAVRAMSRTPEKASALFGSGVEVVRGDFDDHASLQAAIDGVERVFLLTAQMGGRPPRRDGLRPGGAGGRAPDRAFVGARGGR